MASSKSRIQRAMGGVHASILRVKQDRGVKTGIGDLFLTNHVDGDSFVSRTVHGNAKDAGSQEQSLFVNADEESGSDTAPHNAVPEDDNDEYVDDESDFDDEGDDFQDTTRWVNNLAVQIRKLHASSAPNFPTPCPHLAIEPKAHQYRALGLAERCQDSSAKALLIGDPPGLGKTLPAMMAIVKAMASAGRFSIVVAPASCVEQWASEFARFFVPGTVQVLVVRDPTIPPTRFLRYDVIIVSYAFVMTRHRKKVKYLEKIAELNETKQGVPPERPNLSLFSEIFQATDGLKSPHLIFDEVNAVKNPRSLTFAAVLDLRQQCDVCLMLTGSPIDNSWPDVYSLLQFVQGHDIRTKSKMMRYFATPNDKHPGKYKPPQGVRLLKFIQVLNHFIVFKFRLDIDEAAESNGKFDTYQTAIRIAASEVVRSGQNQGTAFKSLTHALQHACHPMLVELMEFIRFDSHKDRTDEEDDVLHDAESIARWTNWREHLKVDNHWTSSRIMALIDVFNKQRDLDPQCSVIIFDESMYFLDIVQIALESMYEPVECLRYDGREAPEKRGFILSDFKEAQGAKVLLMSRAAGGVGLNIAWANVVIQCSPWWKAEWENQAMKRVWRPGQTRPVTFIMLRAENCAAEAYKAKARDRKHKFNTKVINAITREDDDRPRVDNTFI